MLLSPEAEGTLDLEGGKLLDWNWNFPAHIEHLQKQRENPLGFLIAQVLIENNSYTSFLESIINGGFVEWKIRKYTNVCIVYI